jgi:hypothetical protein
LPRPERLAVQVTGMLVVPAKLHTGSPPFLKCALEANAGDANAIVETKQAARITIIRRIISPI